MRSWYFHATRMQRDSNCPAWLSMSRGLPPPRDHGPALSTAHSEWCISRRRPCRQAVDPATETANSGQSSSGNAWHRQRDWSGDDQAVGSHQRFGNRILRAARCDPIGRRCAAPGGDFAATVCIAWEQEARRAKEFGVRTVVLRTGIVLDPSGGALQKLLTPFRLFVGGPFLPGTQWISWIHPDDEIGAIIMALGG